MGDLTQIESTQDVIDYWLDCLSEMSKIGEKKVVLKMLAIARSEYFIAAYENGKNPALAGVFDALAQMDTPRLDTETRSQLWAIIKNHLYSLGVYL